MESKVQIQSCGGKFRRANLKIAATRQIRMIRPMNFLVTGGAGFIGSNLCERLLDGGHAVWALDDLNSFYDIAIKQRNIREIQALAKPFTFVHGDITDRSALDELFREVKFDQIIHLAARAGVRPSLAEPALYRPYW